MHLIIDIGNTRTKLTVFSENEEIYVETPDNLSIDHIHQMINQYNITKSILSSVKKPDPLLLDMIRKNTDQFIDFSHQTPIPLKNTYLTPDTLGKDRIAAVVGANNIFPDQNVLIFDAGTALTIDLVTSTNEYHGGNISPGLHIRFKALHEYTSQLPLLVPQQEYGGIGKNTKEAIVNGVMQGMFNEIDNYIHFYDQQYKNLKVILTGGDADYFDNKIKKSIFVVRNLVAVGLNRIITYNATHH